MGSNLDRNALAELVSPAPAKGLTAWEILLGDDLNNRGPADRSKISLREAWEVRYRTKVLGCTEAQLRAAVSKVGHGSAAVRTHLVKRQK